MASNPVKRVVVCVDSTWYDPNGLVVRREGNNSNIYRIYSSVREGTFVQDNRAVKQVAYYESGVGIDKQPLDNFNDSISTSQEAHDNQVNRVFAFCCQQLSESTDELWLFGFSRGAYVLRVVADLFHQLTTIQTWDEREYQHKVNLLAPFRDSQHKAQSALKVFRYIAAKTWANEPVIHFLGLLDSIRIGREPSRPQPALLRSTRTLRHALALNETRNSFQPCLFGPLPALSPDLAQRSIIEAWFIGSHADIGGGSQEDGLSLYPLQWMLLEGRAHGLIFEPSWDNQSLTEEPLGLVFPLVPDPDPSQPHTPLQPWTFQYRNGIEIEMVDIRSTHRHGNLQAGKKKVLQKRHTRKRNHIEDNASQINLQMLSEQPRKPSWKDRFRLGKKSSKVSLASVASAQSRKDSDIDSLWAPSLKEEVIEVGPRPHVIQINSGPALMSLFSASREVFDSRGLIGYLENSPCGTIIHPSVYFVSDVYDRLGFTGELNPYIDGLNNFRQTGFVKHEVEGNVYMDPWRATLADLGGPELKNCRVLVCGRAGVGKSTLINKVFGSIVTQESSGEHGMHDVDEGFEMDTLPGLIVHDSRGFQSGATEEIELLEKFVKKRAAAARPEDRLDAIWFCIDVPSTRVVHEADRKIFDVLDRYARAVPVILVRTMKDRFINEHYGAAREQLEDAGFMGEELDRRARAQAEEKFARVKEDDIRQLEQKLGLEKDFAPFVYTSKRDKDSIKELVKHTIMMVPDDSARANFVSAQIADIDMKISTSIEESLRLLNFSNWSSVMGSMMLTSVVTTPTISHFICARIIKSFGLSDSAKVNEIERIARALLWKNMGTFVTQSFTQVAVLLGLGVGLTVGTIIGGIPALASLPFAFIPPASRLIAKCTCDLILTLAAAFTRKGKFVTKQDFEESLGQYRAKRAGLGANGMSSVRSLVHNEIDRLIPIHSVKVYEPMSISKMRTEFQRIIARHRFVLDEQFTPAYDEEEADVAVDDVQGLSQWVDRREKSPSATTFYSDRGSANQSPDITRSEPPTNSPSNSPQILHAMKSMDHLMYNTEPKVLQQPAIVAELPGTMVTDPWHGGVSELPASAPRNGCAEGADLSASSDHAQVHALAACALRATSHGLNGRPGAGGASLEGCPANAVPHALGGAGSPTQNAFDPRRIGQQNSGFSDQDISDIICLLYPISEPASHEVQRIASLPEYARHTAGRYTADAIDSDLYHEDSAREFGRTRSIGDHALVLRLSSTLKDPRQGFTFGRNRVRCDICFAFDPGRRLSNIHFRIYVNDYGSVLLEDQSTNGTVVDTKLLRKRPDPNTQTTGPPSTRRTLESGSTIKIVMHESKCDLVFLVRIPRRDGDYEDAYMRNVESYLLRLNGADDLNKTIGPGPSGHVHLFAPPRATGTNNQAEGTRGLQRPSNRLPREWRGGEKYARVGVIGKGAFATVHKVTSKYDGSPYAAKELDKRKFMKNGVLDQKVENEMKIMQKVQHENIVQYIEHFDWDAHQFIIIMEYVSGGDLGKFIQENGAIAEPHVKTIAKQLVNALGYLHDNKITHRDVKPDNILIHSTNPLVVKLTDFGLSKMIDTEQTFLKTFCGTLLYCAPEVYTEYASYDDYGRRTNRKSHRPVDRERYDHAVDIWSLGGVLFYTLTGSPPFPVKNGTTYTELLDHIIKTPLGTLPLTRSGVSSAGVHFLSRMIHVRPETRATIAELWSHPWLNDTRSVTEKDCDEDLGHSASQLSLNDRQPSQITSSQIMITGASSLREPEPDISMDFHSAKENYEFEQPHVPRLFGEVSAIGSSGVIPEERLNLPVSDMSFGETERHGSEVRDSFEDSDDFSTPREAIRGPSQPDNSRSALLGVGSQSLGGASSILENLNMESVANVDSGSISSRISNLATSKRKPNYDTSDEFDMSNVNAKPSFKRLRSEGNLETSDEEDRLFASIPQVVKNDTGRQIDYPQHKTIYWSQNEETWHLNYPEMTHLQYNAFALAAEERNEEFVLGKTPLWDLAMKYFPPTNGYKGRSGRAHTLWPGEINHQDIPTSESDGWDLPPTAPPDLLDNRPNPKLDIPAPDSSFSLDVPSAQATARSSRMEIGVFKSAPGSLVSGISIPLQDPILSWGRETANTVIFQPAMEPRVPKYAFRVLLWKEGYKASIDDFRPWEPARSATGRMTRASSEPDSYAFYIATKATNGIRINGNPLHPNEPKDTTAICKYWMRLYHGDHIAFWGGENPRTQARLIFECFWGGSSVTRPADEPPTCLPAPIARKLDRLWPEAEKFLRRSQLKEKAQIDQEARVHNMSREQQRCRMFEQRRLEAIRRLAQQGSRETSPAKNNIVERARTDPPTHRFAPPSRVQGGR
ncbi:hypothetical protein NUW58_g1658 [Xylaria curta]|uniref:Uncharacterized protein n=1 Tax=Xylaria curta TaxID=42375 RepID=A0ACC1PLR0_9PEZI|nr:hypothetical protein NUW58_g1658 [Xylaria curta]